MNMQPNLDEATLADGYEHMVSAAQRTLDAAQAVNVGVVLMGRADEAIRRADPANLRDTERAQLLLKAVLHGLASLCARNKEWIFGSLCVLADLAIVLYGWFLKNAFGNGMMVIAIGMTVSFAILFLIGIVELLWE